MKDLLKLFKYGIQIVFHVPTLIRGMVAYHRRHRAMADYETRILAKREKDGEESLSE